MKRQTFVLSGAGAVLAGCAAPAMSPKLLTTSGAQRRTMGPDDNVEGKLLGSLLLSPYDFVPQHFEACQGQLIPIGSNPALFSLLGQRFGGDPRRDFALPDLRGKAPHKGLSYLIATRGIYPTRKQGMKPNFFGHPLLGQLSIVAYQPQYVPPNGWAACDGQIMKIRDSVALYSLIGTKFGGDGVTTFALPDLRKHELGNGLTYVIALTGNFPLMR